MQSPEDQDALHQQSETYDDDRMHEECAIFGVWNATGAAKLTGLGLHALQHRQRHRLL